jgi:hypothetical protein
LKVTPALFIAVPKELGNRKSPHPPAEGIELELLWQQRNKNDRRVAARQHRGRWAGVELDFIAMARVMGKTMQLSNGLKSAP